MASYKDLQSQIEKLQKQAEQARDKEIATVVAQIRSMMTEYGIQASDLGISSKRKRKTGTPAAPKFQNPQTGDTWTGRGRAPKWIEGKDRTKFAIK
ncbi:MAG: H-NS histone family protein [Burkholderiaceae bacterium]